MWRLNYGGAVLYTQLRELSPGCEIGTIGDSEHVSNNPSSDHNPKRLNGSNVVNALDLMVKDSEHPRRLTRVEIQETVDSIITSRDRRTKYIIWQGRIIAGNDGPSAWRWRMYGGTDPHTNHAHISLEDIADKITTEWEIGNMPLTDEDIEKIARKVHNTEIGKSGETIGQALDQIGTIKSTLDTVKNTVDTLAARAVK